MHNIFITCGWLWKILQSAGTDVCQYTITRSVYRLGMPSRALRKTSLPKLRNAKSHMQFESHIHHLEKSASFLEIYSGLRRLKFYSFVESFVDTSRRGNYSLWLITIVLRSSQNCSPTYAGIYLQHSNLFTIVCILILEYSRVIFSRDIALVYRIKFFCNTISAGISWLEFRFVKMGHCTALKIIISH